MECKYLLFFNFGVFSMDWLCCFFKKKWRDFWSKPCSYVNSSILTVSRTEDGVAYVSSFFLDEDGSLVLEQNDVMQGPLNPTGVVFDRFLVRSIAANPTSGQGVDSNFISFDIGMTAQAGTRTKNINTLFGVTIKGSY